MIGPVTPLPRRIRVLIVDDSAAMRGALRELLETDPTFQIVGFAASADEAIALAVRVKPDVVTMDLTFPRGNGLDATRALKGFFPNVRVVVVSLSDGASVHRAVFEASADAFVHKSIIAERLLDAMKSDRRVVATSDAWSS
jgi:DNA-binding NarL/FixJ family response regulator